MLRKRDVEARNNLLTRRDVNRMRGQEDGRCGGGERCRKKRMREKEREEEGV